jgi:hypothetical protein
MPAPAPMPMPPAVPFRAMQAGGVVNQPTLALMGEGGPEAVVPLTDYSKLAMNIDPLNPSAAPDPRTGFGMDRINRVRAVSRNNAQQNAYLDSLKAAGKQVMSVVTPESQGYVYPRSDLLQIGNEPDVQGTSMTPQQYAQMWNQYRQQYDGKTGQFVMAGLGSGLGNASAYLDQVWPLLQTKPDQVALHLYDGDTQKSLQEIQDVQAKLQQLGSSAPVVVTEWNKPNDQIWPMLDMLNKNTAWASYFPYSSAQNPSTIGAVGAAQPAQPTSQGASLVSSTVPGLAGGGIVTRPTLAVIGERGPEAVVPLRAS